MNEVIYLLVPPEEHEQAQQRGAEWDPVRLRFFIDADADSAPFLDWLPIDDLEEEEIPELCVAPPLLVAETTAKCPVCGALSPVIALMAEKLAGTGADEPDYLLGKGTAAQDETGDGIDLVAESFGGGVFEEEDEGDDLDGDFDEHRDLPRAALMRFQLVKRLPAAVVGLLGFPYPFYRKAKDGAYYLNYCTACAASFDDLQLHSVPGVGFYLFAPREAERVVLRELPLKIDQLLEASFSRVEPDQILAHARREAFPAAS